MNFLTPELLRVLKPGRVAAIHVKDRILFGNATGTGMPTVDPFSDMTVFHFIKHKFQYMGRITIETDVVRENNQIMGFLDFVGGGGGGLITGLAGTIAGAVSGSKDRKLQEKLQQQQMEYGREMYALQSADENRRMEQQNQWKNNAL